MRDSEQNSRSNSLSTELATVFVVDDDPDVRESIADVLRSVNLRVEAFSSATDFLDVYRPEQPGCLLVDVRLPDMTGLELQQHLLASEISTPLILMSGFSDVSAAIQGMRDGAVDFLQKPCSPHTLLKCVNQALRIDFDQRQREQQHQQFIARKETLSNREGEIMKLLVDGKNAKQIASQLGISRKTVDNHRVHVLEKMHVESVAQLISLVLHDSL